MRRMRSCARAGSEHAIAAPPIIAKKSRRLMGRPQG
jgi:hypothetical protein